MTRSLLLNFTGDSHHWGCHGTCYAIAGHLARLGDVDTVPVERHPEFALESVFESMAYGTSEDFQARHPLITAQIEAADRIVVNGEGTMHGETSVDARALLAMIAAAKVRGRPVHLINHSVFPGGGLDPTSADRPYFEILSAADSIVARDPFSFDFYLSNGIVAIEGFDCLPLFIAERYPEILDETPTGRDVVITGGARIQQGVLEGVLDETLARYGADHRIVHLWGAPGPAMDEDQRAAAFVRDTYKHAARITSLEARDFATFLRTIRHAKLLITGRFHYMVAAMCTGTPFVAVGSDTPKIDIIAAMHGHDGEVLAPSAYDAEGFARLLNDFDNGTRMLSAETPFEDLVAAARRNFDDLPAPPGPLDPDDLPARIAELSREGRHAQLAYLFDDLAPEARRTLRPAPVIDCARANLALGRPERAAALCRDVLARYPGVPNAHSNLLIALLATDDTEAALAAALTAEEACPDVAIVLFYAGRAASAADRPSDAARMLEKAVEAEPGHYPSRLHLARIYAEGLGQTHDSLFHALEGLRLRPMDGDLHRLAGEAYLRLGVFGPGFDHYRDRLQLPRYLKQIERQYRYPPWDGGEIEGRLLVIPERGQGVGFELLATSLLPDLERIGHQVVFEISGKLISTVAARYPGVHFVPFRLDGAPGIESKNIGAQIYFSELCSMLRREIGDFPGRGPAIARAPDGRPMRIGISWSTTNRVDGPSRTISLADWLPLFRGLPMDVTWVNLQYGDVSGEITRLAEETGIEIEHDPERNYFTDIVPLMETIGGLDAVVSIENSTVFFAGLLGKPVFLLLPPAAHWIWGVSDARSLWVPSAEILRRRPADPWETVFLALRNRLALS